MLFGNSWKWGLGSGKSAVPVVEIPIAAVKCGIILQTFFYTVRAELITALSSPGKKGEASGD